MYRTMIQDTLILKTLLLGLTCMFLDNSLHNIKIHIFWVITYYTQDNVRVAPRFHSAPQGFPHADPRGQQLLPHGGGTQQCHSCPRHPPPHPPPHRNRVSNTHVYSMETAWPSSLNHPPRHPPSLERWLQTRARAQGDRPEDQRTLAPSNPLVPQREPPHPNQSQGSDKPLWLWVRLR